MGLDASVACNCYRDGLTTEPPIDRSLIEIRPTGEVALADHDIGDWSAFNDWHEAACEHPYMELVAERVGNIATVAWFRAMAGHLDRSRFGRIGALIASLSGLMDSSTPAVDIEAALPELMELLTENRLGTSRMVCGLGGVVVDFDLDWGPVDYDRLAPIRGFHGSHPPRDEKVRVGVQGYEFVITSWGDEHSELLRARWLRQNWDDPAGSMVTFANDETSESIRVRSRGIVTDADKRPALLFVSERAVMVAEFRWMLATLKTLFEASIASGNSVAWH